MLPCSIDHTLNILHLICYYICIHFMLYFPETIIYVEVSVVFMLEDRGVVCRGCLHSFNAAQREDFTAVEKMGRAFPTAEVLGSCFSRKMLARAIVKVWVWFYTAVKFRISVKPVHTFGTTHSPSWPTHVPSRPPPTYLPCNPSPVRSPQIS